MATQSDKAPTAKPDLAALPRSEATRWHRADTDNGTDWVRRATGVEALLFHHNIEHHHEHNAHLPVVVQIKDASVPDLKERIAHAWTRLFAEIPSMSVTLHSPQPHSPPAAPTKTHASNAAPPAGRSENAVQTTTSPFSSAADYIKSLVPLLMSTSLATTLLVWLLTTTAKRKKAGFVEARYSTEATKEVTDKWLRDTLRFREMKDVASTAKSSQEGLDAAEAAMRDLTSELIAEGISHEATGLVGLDAVFFAQGYVGLGLRFHHSNFDGTAIYLMLDELLSRLSTTPAHPRKHTFPLRKPDPTPVAIQSIPTSKFDADYAKDLRGYISKSITVAASSPTTPTAPIHYTGHVRQARHTFSASETATLLAAAKKTGVTISQIAAILHLVPLVKRRPPKRPAKDQVAFQTTINVRDTIGIKERFFGNAFLMPDNPVPASVVTGPSLDRKGVLDAAQAVTKELNYQKENGIWIGAFMEYTLNVLLDTGATVLPQNPFTSLLSDGLLERYFKRQYDGTASGGLSIEVFFVAIQMSVQNISMAARTSTFRDRLMLAYDYNDEAWRPEDVQAIVGEWADALRDVLLSASDKTN